MLTRFCAQSSGYLTLARQAIPRKQARPSSHPTVNINCILQVYAGKQTPAKEQTLKSHNIVQIVVTAQFSEAGNGGHMLLLLIARLINRQVEVFCGFN